MLHTIWDVPVFAGIQDKIKDSPTQTKENKIEKFWGA